MKGLLFYRWLCPLAVAVLLLGCQAGPSATRVRDIAGVNVRTGLLIVLNKDVTSEQIVNFWDEVLGVPRPKQGPTAFDLRPGISGVMASSPIDGHETISVDFWPDTSREQRDVIIRDVKASPLVYKVIENVVPSSVKSVDSDN